MPSPSMLYRAYRQALDIELKEGLVNKIKPVLIPQNYPNSEFRGGVHSPFVIQDPDTIQNYLLFLGQKDGTYEYPKELFIAEIDEELNVTNIRKLGVPEITDMQSIGALWDVWNDKWLIFVGTGGASGSYLNGAVLEFDRDFTTYTIYDTNLPYTSCVGINPVPLMWNGRFIVTVSNRDVDPLQIYLSAYPEYGFTQRPLPTATDYGQVLFPHRWRVDVYHHFFLWGTQPVMLVEKHSSDYGPLQPVVAFAHPSAFYGQGYDFQIGRAGFVYSEKPAIPLNISAMAQAGFFSPHFTTLLKRPMLFFTVARSEHRTYNPEPENPYKWRRELWALELPLDYFDPKKWFPLVGGAVHVANGDSKYFPTFGARKLIVFVYNVVTDGSLHILGGQTIGDLVTGVQYLLHSENVTSGNKYYIVIDDPPNVIKFWTDGEVYLWFELHN